MIASAIHQVQHRIGHRMAEAWYGEFQRRGEQAHGYFFPSQLRQAFADLPPAEQGHFLDAIGAFLVFWLVSGEPMPGMIDTAEEIQLHALPPAEQDVWAQSQERSAL